jgi:hypothetical protein
MHVPGKDSGYLALCLAAMTLTGCSGPATPPATPAPAAGAVEAPATPARVYGDPAAPVAGRVLDTVIHTRDAEELRYVVLKELADRYATSQGITVTAAEQEAHVAREREALSKDAAVAAELGKESAEDQAARLESAAAFIKQWKINRALYQQYGGRIIYQQGGPEPFDAYRKFLEERQAAGDFSIEDEAMAAAFWRYYRDDSIHSFFERGSPEEVKAFGAEPWATGT